MLAVDRWVIHYGDGSVFSSDDGTWAEAPALGVFGVVYYLANGKRIVQMEQHDLATYLWPEYVPRPTGAVEAHGIEAGGGPAKMGLWVSNGQYFKLFDLVHGRELTP